MAPTASELESEVSSLQNLVFRLSQEVSRNAPTDERREETKRVLDELPDHVRVPQWLTSVDVLSPLLRAFDSCTDELKRNIEDGKAKFRDLEEKAKAVVAENASLRQEVVELTEKVVRIQEQGLRSTSFPDNADSRLKLLEEENDLLRAQTGQLDKEIAGLHTTLDEKDEILLSLQDQKATSFDSMHDLQRENNALKAKLIDSESRLQDLSKKVDVLEESKAGARAGDSSEGLDLGPGIKVTQERADKAKLEMAALREENTQLSEEVANQRVVVQSMTTEAADLRSQVVSLTDLTSRLELRTSEMQTKEFDSINLIQSLNERLKQEKALNEIHAKTRSDLEKEIKEMRHTTRGHAKGLKASLKDLYHTRVSVAESSVRQMEDLVSNLKKVVGHTKAQYERAQRDADFYKNQASEMKDLNKRHPSKVDEYLKRVEKLEEERDAAIHESSSTSGMVKRIRSDHERLVNSLTMERERAQKLAQISTAECKKLQEELLQMHSLVKDSESALRDAQKLETDTRDTMAQKFEVHKAESSEQIKFLKKRLEEELESKRETVVSKFQDKDMETNASFQASKREAEDAKLKYESMERQARAESIQISRKLEGVTSENAKLRDEISQVTRHLKILTQQNREAHDCIGEAENELISLKERLKSAVSKEAQLIQEKEDIYAHLEAAKLEVSKAKRGESSSKKKVDFLRNQCETLQHALASSRILPSVQSGVISGS